LFWRIYIKQIQACNYLINDKFLCKCTHDVLPIHGFISTDNFSRWLKSHLNRIQKWPKVTEHRDFRWTT
jgi:hypothetical protein